MRHKLKIAGWVEICNRYGGGAINSLSVAWTAASIVFQQKAFRNLFIDGISV